MRRLPVDRSEARRADPGIRARLAQPIFLLQVAHMAGFVLVVASLHLLHVNTRLLPEHVRPPMWRRAGLVAMSPFYGFFVTRSAMALWSG
jgi:hypothetical protein